MTRRVLVVIGPASGAPRKADLAAVRFAAECAEALGSEFDALVLDGGDVDLAPVREVVAGTVHHLRHDDLREYTAEASCAALERFLAGRDPAGLIVAASDSRTRETFPRLAARLGAPMASDVVGVEAVDAERAAFTRAVFAGGTLATATLDGPVALATCRASEFAAPEARAIPAEVVEAAIDGALLHPRKRFVSSRRESSPRPDLSDAEIVVSVGRGVRGPEEGLPLAERLADALGAALGASRAVVDAGWLPNELQVGQTGKIIAPRLYIAVGLSGAIQHLAGMRNAKTIVAINKDAEAPIFEVADLGLVADLFEAVPALAAALEARRGGN